MTSDDLPPDWSWMTMAQLLRALSNGRLIEQGWSPQCHKQPSPDNATWGVLKTTSIQPGEYLGEHNKCLPDDLTPNPSIEVHDGDLLLTCAGPRARCAIPCLIRTTRPRLMISGKMYRFRADESVIDARFLELFLLSPTAQKSLDTMKTGISDSGLNLTQSRFLGLDVVVPELEEQRRIVDILEDHLSRLDAAEHGLKLSRRRLASYEAVALSLCRDGNESPLGDVTEIQGGIQKQPKRAPKQNAYPFLRVANVTKNGLDLDEVHLVELFDGELDRLCLQPGDLLVVEGNGSPSQIGRAALWDGSIADCVHQNHLIRVRPKSGLSAPYLEAVWNSPQNRRQLTELASSSSGLHTLSVSKLKSLKLPLPTLARQRELVTEVQDIRDRRGRLDAELELAASRTQQLRQSLLSAAFSGRLTGRTTDREIVEEMADV